jgi:hypothetical protein
MVIEPAVAREDRGSVAVPVPVDQADGILISGGPYHRQDRAEDLLLVNLHAGPDPVDERQAKEEPWALRQGVIPAVGDDRRAHGPSRVEEPGHAVAVLAGDERAHFGRGVCAGTDPHPAEPAADRVHQFVRNPPDRNEDRDRHAPLAGRTIRSRDRCVRGRVEVGVSEDDHMILGAAERLDALPPSRALLVDLPRDRR